MFIRRLLFTCSPVPSYFERSSGGGMTAVIFRPLRSMYVRWWLESQKRVIAWHRRELQRLDVRFRHAEATRQLIRARELARRAGVGPLDRNYPDLDDFLS